MDNIKTINNLGNAAPLSDVDLLALYQPNVFNIITQQPGDTKKLTVAAFGDYLSDAALRYIQKLFVGQYVDFGWRNPPTNYQLAKMRILELKYQIIEIADYQDLCDMYWVGASANATAYFWYKCDQNGTRNVNGLFMRVEDSRGMFYRVAGANAVLRTDMSNPNSPPYNGADIGSFQKDDNKSHAHLVRQNQIPPIVVPQGDYYGMFIGEGQSEPSGGIEAKPASLSFARYIRY